MISLRYSSFRFLPLFVCLFSFFHLQHRQFVSSSGRFFPEHIRNLRLNFCSNSSPFYERVQYACPVLYWHIVNVPLQCSETLYLSIYHEWDCNRVQFQSDFWILVLITLKAVFQTLWGDFVMDRQCSTTLFQTISSYLALVVSE